MFADTRLIRYLPTVILPAIWVTLKIIFFSAVISITLGLLLGILLVVTEPDGLKPNKVFHSVLGKVTDVIRSFPTIVLIVAVAPLTRLLIGTTIGANAAIFAITLACTPYATRMTENALHTVDEQLIEEILQETDAEKLKDLTNLFNIFQTKREVLRVNKLNDVQDALVQQMLDRLEQQPHNFDNKDIALWVKTVQLAKESSRQSLEKVEAIPTIVHQNNTQVNINVEESLSRESRERVLSVLNTILGKNAKNDNTDGVLNNDGGEELSPLEEIDEEEGGTPDDK